MFFTPIGSSYKLVRRDRYVRTKGVSYSRFPHAYEHVFLHVWCMIPARVLYLHLTSLNSQVLMPIIRREADQVRIGIHAAAVYRIG